jgi:hypothetical protein
MAVNVAPMPTFQMSAAGKIDNPRSTGIAWERDRSRR